MRRRPEWECQWNVPQQWPSQRTLVLSSQTYGWSKCVVADHTCRNMPIIIQRVAEVRNITGICQVKICKWLGALRPVFEECLLSPLVFWRILRMLANPSRCDDRRCSRTVWSAAVRILKSERMIPQYQDVLTGHGDCSPFGKMEGQLPVDVRTPAKRADYNMSAQHWSLQSL